MSYAPIFHPKVDKLLHGADYNPDQWLHMPEIIDEDFRLMKLARCSIMSVGIFAWAAHARDGLRSNTRKRIASAPTACGGWPV